MIIPYTDRISPKINAVAYSPEAPTEEQGVTIAAIIVDEETGIVNATLNYSLDDGAHWNSTPMKLQTDNKYASSIPQQKAGTKVQFYIVAYDYAGNRGETPLISYTVQISPLLLIAIGSLIIGGFAVILIYRRRAVSEARKRKYLHREGTPNQLFA